MCKTISPQEALQGRSWAIVSDWGVYDLYREKVVAESICNDLNRRYGSDKYAVAHIEQPTCREVEDEDTGIITCSECGAVQPEDYTVYHCWSCGAKVVRP